MTESEATEREPDPTGERLRHRGGAPEPDVLLDIPEVTVDQLRLAVDGLDADLSLRARLANLVQLDAGVRVHLEGVELDLTGVSAEALLKVRLEKLVQILDRALTTLDRNPQVIDALARAAGGTAEDVNRVAREVVDGVGEPVVDQAGQQIGTVGAVADQALRERPAAPTPPAGPPAAGPRSPEPPTGPTGQPPGPVPPFAGGPAAGGGPAGGGGPAKPAGGGRGMEGAGRPSDAGETASGGAAPTPGGAGAEPAAGGGQKEAGEGGGGPASGAAQLAGQAGETLRHAGRSVWEAIQNGMGQNREQRPKR